MSWEERVSIIASIVQTLAIVLGGAWALRRYIFHKESYPRIVFSVDVNFVGVHGDYWLVELLGVAENKGAVPHVMTELNFELRSLDDSDPLRDGGTEINLQTEIPRVLRRGSWLPQQKHKFILQPGVSLRYNHVAHVPRSARFVLLHGTLALVNRLVARADRLCRVPAVSGVTQAS